MDSRLLAPFFVDVVAHLLDKCRHEMRADRLVFASLNFDSRWSPVARELLKPSRAILCSC
jgi:hypothetical protein